MTIPKLKPPRILIVTPEVTYLPDRMGSISACLTAKAGGLADVSAALICELYRQGADVHVAVPNYRAIFGDCLTAYLKKEQSTLVRHMPQDRLYLAQDRAFYHRRSIYSGDYKDNIRLALAFQREVINTIIPRVNPDLIHCNDWMTGLVPAAARQMGRVSLFTIHNIHTMKILPVAIEDHGIDVATFWQQLYFERMPGNYEDSRHSNPIDLLPSAVFSAHFVNTVSPHFLSEILMGQHDFVGASLRHELRRLWDAGRVFGILNAPDPTYNPADDQALVQNYGPHDHASGKRANKDALQQQFGLIEDVQAPLFLWPSRLDPAQKGCELLAGILYAVITKYWDQKLQLVFVADGAYEPVFKDMVAFHDIGDRVAVCGFDVQREHQGYAAADFVLMPSRFEPCGLPQMIGPLYGCLPVAHDTGGIHDTVMDLDLQGERGNGFLFKNYDSQGLAWAIDQAMQFYQMPSKVKARQIERIMTQSMQTFNYGETAKKYIELYEKLLGRPVITS